MLNVKGLQKVAEELSKSFMPPDSLPTKSLLEKSINILPLFMMGKVIE